MEQRHQLDERATGIEQDRAGNQQRCSSSDENRRSADRLARDQDPQPARAARTSRGGIRPLRRSVRSEIFLVRDDQRFSASSILEVRTANLDQGQRAAIAARGSDAERAVNTLAKLMQSFTD